MNVLTDTADGLRALTRDEAQQRIDQLRRVWERTPSLNDRERITREIDALQRITVPHTAYDEWRA